MLGVAVVVALLAATRAARVPVPSTVMGVAGYPASIPCDLTPPGPGDSPHLILWYKNIFGTPIYRCCTTVCIIH